jgi:hypothetical protein
MRVSDDRYSRDRHRMDLALRLVCHEARTFTIREWTGLSDDRIRKLYRRYLMNQDARLNPDARRPLRHRGKSPRQVAFFFRNAELNFQAAQLASLFVVFGLLRGSDLGVEARFSVGSLDAGTLLCQAYESYLEFHVPASISFEHAWFLLLALARREEIAVAQCDACGGVRLRDLLSKRRLTCGNCEHPSFTAAAGLRTLAPC